MTPEQRAEKITAGWLGVLMQAGPAGTGITAVALTGDMVQVVRNRISNAIRDAVAEEREACAALADREAGKMGAGRITCRSIAHNIRARATP